MNPVPWKALALSFAAATAFVGSPAFGPLSPGVALADDDDGGGGGGDDDDGGGGGRGGGRGSDSDDDGPGRPAPQRPRAPSRPSVSAPPPEFRPEIVALDLAEADLDTLLAQGFTLLETEEVPSFAATLRRLLPPSDLTLDDARAVVRSLASGGNADFNHYYRGEQGAATPLEPAQICEGQHCVAFDQIGWPAPTSRAACGPDVVIGLVDTSINAAHDTFDGARLTVHGLADPELRVSAELHGTSVTALFVGAPDGRTPGLVPDLPVVAVDAFHRDGSDERADAFTLIRALGLLAEEEARVINLSLAGPANETLEAALAQLTGDAGVVVVAAAGNGGPRAAPAYPAAYDGVIAVTAVDRSGAVYRRAGQGEHIDLAAPGVEVWTAASIRGGRPKSGTSFAAPFVTAAAARLLQEQPGLQPLEVEAALTGAALDLGEAGEDPVFGHGLLQSPAGCAEATSATLGE